MIKYLIKILILAIITLKNHNALALNATINAEVLKGLSIVETSSLNFGQLAPGTVTSVVNQNGSIISGDADVVSGTSHAGSFFVTDNSNNNTAYTITIDSTILLKDPSLTYTMNVTNVAVSGGNSRNLSNGDDTFLVNGRLTISPSQQPAIYTGFYFVDVSF